MSEYREAALSFEAVKIRMTQNKDGIILRLAVHPQESAQVAHRLCGSAIGVALVALADDETPKHGPELEEIKKLKASAGALCRDADFKFFPELPRKIPRRTYCELNWVCNRVVSLMTMQMQELSLFKLDKFQSWLKNKR